MFKKCMLSLACAFSFSFANTEFINEGYCFANKINVNVCKSFSLFGSIFDNLDSIDSLLNDGLDKKDSRVRKQVIAFAYNNNELCPIYNKLNTKDKELLKQALINANFISSDEMFQNITKDFSNCKEIKESLDKVAKTL